MADQPKSSRSSVSNINISGKINIHFNLLSYTGSAFLSVFEEGNKETNDRLSIASSLCKAPVLSGVQQGSIIGKLTVISYVNDIHYLASPTQIFAYDSLVISPVAPSTIPDTVQGSLQQVEDYSVAYGKKKKILAYGIWEYSYHINILDF